MRRLSALLFVSTLTVAGQEKLDLPVLSHIKHEAFQNSQVMDDLFYLTDVYGPRLTNSPGHKQAAEWVMNRLRAYGLENVHEESWGPFGESWRLKFFSAHLLEPQYQPLIGIPLAWTPSTAGVIKGEPVMAVINSEADFERFRGKLKDRVVLSMEPKVLALSSEPLSKRLTDEDLLAREQVLDPSRPYSAMTAPDAAPVLTAEQREAATVLRKKVAKFFKDEGVSLVLQYGYNGDGGTVFATNGGSPDPSEPVPAPTVALTPEHYNRIARLLQHKIPVKVEFDVRAEFLGGNDNSFNVIGEIPGTTNKDEIVMLGGHLDSWHGATGATDNATGSAVAMEAVRILKALNQPFARTIRIALWGGEEEGLLGSMAYVQDHFAQRDSMQLKPEFLKLSAYYNDDGGTGRFRGIGVGGNDAAKPIFESWLAPLHDLGATAVVGTTAPMTTKPGGTDHTSFTWIGLPGFNFLQEPMEYQTRTHHSNMDFYDRVQAGDVMQGAAIEAWFVYNTAMRKEMMPRLELPGPKVASPSTSSPQTIPPAAAPPKRKRPKSVKPAAKPPVQNPGEPVPAPQ